MSSAEPRALFAPKMSDADALMAAMVGPLFPTPKISIGVTALNDVDVEIRVSAYSALSPAGAVMQALAPAASIFGVMTSPKASTRAVTGPHTDEPAAPTATATVSAFPPTPAITRAVPSATALISPVDDTETMFASGVEKVIA